MLTCILAHMAAEGTAAGAVLGQPEPGGWGWQQIPGDQVCPQPAERKPEGTPLHLHPGQLQT